MKMEVRRTIVYQGDEEWLKKTLSKSISLSHPLDCGQGTSIKLDGEHWFPIGEAKAIVVDAEREAYRG